jgi:hypothetical protein
VGYSDVEAVASPREAVACARGCANLRVAARFVVVASEETPSSSA